jgi:hypothetical protein
MGSNKYIPENRITLNPVPDKRNQYTESQHISDMTVPSIPIYPTRNDVVTTNRIEQTIKSTSKEINNFSTEPVLTNTQGEILGYTSKQS